MVFLLEESLNRGSSVLRYVEGKLLFDTAYFRQMKLCCKSIQVNSTKSIIFLKETMKKHFY